MKWLSIWWYQYLIEDNTGIRNILCRIDGHSCGVRFYTLTGYEPDMRCLNCDEDLG